MVESREDEFRRMLPNQAAREDSRDVSLCVTCGKQCEAYLDELGAHNLCFDCCPHDEGFTYDRGDRQYICSRCSVPKNSTKFAYED